MRVNLGARHGVAWELWVDDHKMAMWADDLRPNLKRGMVHLLEGCKRGHYLRSRYHPSLDDAHIVSLFATMVIMGMEVEL